MSTVLTVSQLNRQIKLWLEQDVGDILVQGEISNLSKASSGHWYFTLKDNQAQLRSVLFKNRQQACPKDLDNGHQVMAQGRLSLYEARGDYQLIVDSIAPAGLGDLHQQFEALKQKLMALGLFDSARKKTCPRYPSTIGIITSPTGAALRDILSTLARRYPLAKVRIYPSDVQGKLAPGLLVAAIQQANREAVADVLILARGGGSLEDLWAFNEEILAYAIAESQIPIVSGVGHETDFTIADFVADLRAPTPTGAAELVCPAAEDLLETISQYQQRLSILLQQQLKHYQIRLNSLMFNLTSPKRMISHYWQRLDYAERQLNQAFKQGLIHKQHRLESAMTHLHGISPLATLQRGYAVVTQQGQLVTEAAQLEKGALVSIRLAQGQLSCVVDSTYP